MGGDPDDFARPQPTADHASRRIILAYMDSIRIQSYRQLQIIVHDKRYAVCPAQLHHVLSQFKLPASC
ncbi:hypothetical protein D3C81_1666580 [compost metagenome]